MKFAFLLVSGFLLSLPAAADPLSGRVIKVVDGDTLDILDANYQTTRIRLAEIDSPEKSQAFGNKAKEALSSICFGKTAEATPNGSSHRGRVVAYIKCGGVDANRTMVATGYAWAYPQFVKDKSLFDLEKSARERRIGLWADSSPTPPWEWRHKEH